MSPMSFSNIDLARENRYCTQFDETSSSRDSEPVDDILKQEVSYQFPRFITKAFWVANSMISVAKPRTVNLRRCFGSVGMSTLKDWNRDLL